MTLTRPSTPRRRCRQPRACRAHRHRRRWLLTTAAVARRPWPARLGDRVQWKLPVAGLTTYLLEQGNISARSTSRVPRLATAPTSSTRSAPRTRGAQPRAPCPAADARRSRSRRRPADVAHEGDQPSQVADRDRPRSCATSCAICTPTPSFTAAAAYERCHRTPTSTARPSSRCATRPAGCSVSRPRPTTSKPNSSGS